MIMAIKKSADNVAKRKYQPIWEAIKKAPEGESVVVTCHNPERVIQAVKKEKARDNIQRKSVGVLTFGKLEVVQDIKNKRVSFRLKYNCDNL